MIGRGLLIPLALLCAAVASAHRVDEYLQATRLSIDIERVDLEIDLTTGMQLSSTILNWIDTNRDGEISTQEGDAYAQQVLRAVVLSVDGKPAPITFVDSRFPQLRDMRLGIGTIRLRATAKVPAARAGHHQISFLNTHHPESSVYLVNALVPATPRIQIGDQRRDGRQRGITLDYMVTAEPPSARAFALLAGLAIAGRWFLRKRSAH
jgi:hypothetical protein